MHNTATHSTAHQITDTNAADWPKIIHVKVDAQSGLRMQVSAK
jgi:hypothetical protein